MAGLCHSLGSATHRYRCDDYSRFRNANRSGSEVRHRHTMSTYMYFNSVIPLWHLFRLLAFQLSRNSTISTAAWLGLNLLLYSYYTSSSSVYPTPNWTYRQVGCFQIWDALDVCEVSRYLRAVTASVLKWKFQAYPPCTTPAPHPHVILVYSSKWFVSVILGSSIDTSNVTFWWHQNLHLLKVLARTVYL